MRTFKAVGKNTILTMHSASTQDDILLAVQPNQFNANFSFSTLINRKRGRSGNIGHLEGHNSCIIYHPCIEIGTMHMSPYLVKEALRSELISLASKI